MDPIHEFVLHPDTQKLVAMNAHRLAGRYGLTRADIPDLESELNLVLLAEMPSWDPARGNRTVFAQVVIDSRIRRGSRSR